jgi:hypothetical protein
MPKYLCVRRSQPNVSSAKSEMPSPAQMEAMYAKFNEWKAQFQQNIVDMGGKLTGGGKVLTMDGAKDGPFVEAKEVIGGFMILSAKSIDEAMEIARQCPGVIMPGASLEIREFVTA